MRPSKAFASFLISDNIYGYTFGVRRDGITGRHVLSLSLDGSGTINTVSTSHSGALSGESEWAESRAAARPSGPGPGQ